MAAIMSEPLAISRTCERRALGLSRVTMIGGLGLFLDPGGRPRGRRPEEVPPPPDEAGSDAAAADGEWSSSLLPLLLGEEGMLSCCESRRFTLR